MISKGSQKSFPYTFAKEAFLQGSRNHRAENTKVLASDFLGGVASKYLSANKSFQNIAISRLAVMKANEPNVAILLGAYNGQEYLKEQLASIKHQIHRNWIIYVSDDQSTDSTYSILRRFQAANPFKVIVKRNNKNLGFRANFLSMICDQEVNADLYSFSDQDDVWEVDKLKRAVEWISQVPDQLPALYCSRTRIVSEDDIEQGCSPLFSKAPSFSNALVQSIGGGNTMLFNEAARQLLAEAGADVDVASHDWWAYLLISGCGGVVFYDQKPSLRYRQHSQNFIGANSSWSARLERIRMIFAGQFKKWNDGHIQGLARMRHQLTPENIKTLDAFISARQGSVFSRLARLLHSKVYRQTVFGNLGLIVASVFNKL